jgi:glycolate dehydrogenase FAD-binding subunit
MTATAATSRLEERLRRTAPADWFGAAPVDYPVDGITPSFVVSPDSPEAVSAVLADADKAGAAVIPWGGGSHMGLGMPPERYDLALDLKRLDSVIAYEPADLTVTVQAGIRLSDLQKRLAEQGQWLPLDPPCAAEATIGGILATNATGPARIAYGTARDLVIGITIANVEGQLVKSGGRVVKNVAGYDLAKMHIGGLGTLGVITQVSLKVAPTPRVTRSMAVVAEDCGALLRAAFLVRDAGLPATGIAISMPADAGEARLLLRFAGSEAAVDRSCAEAAKIAGSLGLKAEQLPDSTWSETDAPRAGGGAVARAVHAASASGEVLREASALNADVLCYPTAGTTFARLLALTPASLQGVQSLRAAVEARGGALVVEAASAEVKRRIGVWGAPRVDFALMRALKEQMDPKRTLSPGRFVGGL